MHITKLTKESRRQICIKRLSGASQKELGEKYDIRPKGALAVQRSEYNIMTWLTPVGDDWKITNKGDIIKKAGAANHTRAVINGDLVFEDIEITGNIADGVIYARGCWQYNNTQKEHVDMIDIGFLPFDVGVVKGKIKVGALYLVTKDTANNTIEEAKVIEKACVIDRSILEATIKTLDVPVGGVVSNRIVGNVLDNTPVIDPSVHLRDVEAANDELVDPEPPVAPEEFTWSASNQFIAITQGRESWNADASHPDFKAAQLHLINGEIQQAIDLIHIEKKITEFVQGAIVIKDGVLRYNNFVLTNGIAKRIIERMQAGEDFEFFLPFLNNLMENPSEKAVNRLFDFLEANDIEITEDGHFLTFKRVAGNYMDLYRGEYDNTPNGKNPPRMPRNQVDEDDNTTCSRGLHVCAKSYLSSYGNGHTSRVVLCKVHPRDVVSIPVDYDNAKMRTCGYVVIKDVTDEFKAQ